MDSSIIAEAYRFPDKVKARWLHHPEQFVKVAEVETSSRDRVWAITQNIDDSWTKQPEIKWCLSPELRSTSVGDVIVHGGKAWLVLREGFMETVKPKVKRQAKHS